MSLLKNQSSNHLADHFKKELMMNLIAQTYLNLARNEENREFLVDLQLFKKLKKLVDKYIQLEDGIRIQAAGENT